MIQIIAFLLALFTAFTPNTQKINGDYDVYNNEGLHLFINDNNTPTDYSDDWVYDWEDNRQARVFVFDK